MMPTREHFHATEHLGDDLIIHHTVLPETALSRRVDAWLRLVGEAVSWIWLLLVAVVTVNVVMRYALGRGLVQFEELQWHLYAIGFMIGIAYCFESDDHVRIDILHERLSLTGQVWVEFYGLLLLLFPFLALVLIHGVPFVWQSFLSGEVSASPGGLPYRWAIKAVLLIAFGLLTLGAVSRFSRVLAYLYGWPRALGTGGQHHGG